jgi:hypothetical protein
MNNLHIHCTIRKPELREAATLVFKTLRTGFPTANVFVYGNALSAEDASYIKSFLDKGCSFKNVEFIMHDAWVEQLIKLSTEPFWICDTDIVFFGSIEDFSIPKSEGLFGRFEPRFREEWTQTIHLERIHTAVMRIDPIIVRNEFRRHMCKIPEPWRNSGYFPFVQQTFVPLDSSIYFYDTCAGIYHAIGGKGFSKDENAYFEHLHCATYSDLVSKHLSCSNLQEVHKVIFANPEMAKGLQSSQNEYYSKQAVKI